MAEKDLSDFSLLEYDDVYADVYNAYSLGAGFMDPGDLSPLDPRLVTADGMNPHGLTQDMRKLWVNRHVKLVDGKYGQVYPKYYTTIENMTESDNHMVIHERVYDGAGYQKQLLNARSAERKLYLMLAQKEAEYNMPVVLPQEAKQDTLVHPELHLVLNYSFHRWKENHMISEVDNFPQEIALLPESGRPTFKDGNMFVADVAFTTPEQLELMKSDFRYVAELLVKLRTGQPIEFSEAKVIHLNELMQVFAALTGDPGYLSYRVEKKTDGGDKKVYNMRKVIADYEAGKMLCEDVHALKQNFGLNTEQALKALNSSAEKRALYYQASGEQAP